MVGKKKEKRKKRLEKWFSPKQLIVLQNYSVKFNEWLKNNGEPPAVLDTNAINTSKKESNNIIKI